MWAVRTQQVKWESLALPLLLNAHTLTSLVLDMKETRTMCGVQTFPTHTCTHTQMHTHACTHTHKCTHITGSPVPIFEHCSITSKVPFSPLHLETGLFLWVTPSLLHRLAEREKGQQTPALLPVPAEMGLPQQTGKAHHCHVSLDSNLAKSI